MDLEHRCVLLVVLLGVSACAISLYAPIGRSVLSNLHIPCLHADPHFGHIHPGEKKERTINVIFAETNWRQVVKSIVKNHVPGTAEQTKPDK